MRAAPLLVAILLVLAGCLSSAGREGAVEPVEPLAEPDEDPAPPAEAQVNATEPANASAPSPVEPRRPEPPQAASEPVHPADPTVRLLYETYKLGEPITVQAWSDRSFELSLAVSATLVPGLWAETDDVRHAPPWLEAVEGTVRGTEDSQARLLFTDTFLAGLVRVGTDTYFIRFADGAFKPFVQNLTEGLIPFDPRMAGGDGPSPAGLAIDDDPFCLHPAPVPASPVLSVLGEPSPLALGIIGTADGSFAKVHGEDTHRMMALWLHMADAVYEREVGVRVQVLGLHLLSDEAGYGDENPLVPAASHWNQRDDTRDLVHVFAHNGLGFAQANCIGGAGDPTLAYTFTDASWATRSHYTALVHEWGHILSAHHHYANCAETVVLCTLMVNDVGLNLKYAFSSLNRAAIRGYAEANLGPFQG